LTPYAKTQGALLFLFLLLVGLFGSCSCPGDPGSIDVSPDCDSRQAAASIDITADLSSIRPLGSEIQLKIRGNRAVDADLCFQLGAEVSFLQAINGTGTKTELVSNLAHGSWSIEITALSGGNQEPVKLSKILIGGTTHHLSISGNDAGDLTASFVD